MTETRKKAEEKIKLECGVLRREEPGEEPTIIAELDTYKLIEAAVSREERLMKMANTARIVFRSKGRLPERQQYRSAIQTILSIAEGEK